MKPPSDALLAPATLLASDRLANLFNEAFADYLIRFPPMTPEVFRRFLDTQGIDLELSRVVHVGGRPAGFGFVHAADGCCRLAGMGVVPAARRRGVAGALLDALLQEAVERGDRLMTLEVFEQNSGALALYQSRGFRTLARLHGWSRDGTSAQPLPTPANVAFRLEPISLADLTLTRDVGDGARKSVTPPIGSQVPGLGPATDGFGYPSLPWQISPSAVRRMPASFRAYVAGATLAVVVEPEPGTLRLGALLPLRELEDPWASLRLTAARLLDEFPRHRWSIPAVFPEPYGARVFGPLGFGREALNQWHMHWLSPSRQQSK